MSGPSPSAILSLLRSQLAFCPPLPTSSFAGQTAIVTGANTGLGRETAKHLVRLGASLVILAVRTPSKGEDAVRYIEKETGRKGCMQVWQLDMSSFESVKQFSKRVEEELERVDVLVCNAGMWPSKFELAEGYEESITVNVLSTILLTRLLIPKMQKTSNPTPRITLLSSALHKFATLPARHNPSIFPTYKEPLAPKEFDNRYYDTKLLLMLCGLHLASTFNQDSICLNLVNPGWCASGLKKGNGLGEKVLMRSTEQGARIVVDAISAGKEGRYGAYLDDCEVKKPASWLGTKEGKEVGERVWREVNEILAAWL